MKINLNCIIQIIITLLLAENALVVAAFALVTLPAATPFLPTTASVPASTAPSTTALKRHVRRMVIY